MKRIRINIEESYDEHLEFGKKENGNYGFYCKHEDNFESERDEYIAVLCYTCEIELDQIEYDKDYEDTAQIELQTIYSAYVAGKSGNY